MAIKRCITISFKNTKKDTALYELLMDMEDRSTEVKQILYKSYFSELNKSVDTRSNKKNEKEDINILDF